MGALPFELLGSTDMAGHIAGRILNAAARRQTLGEMIRLEDGGRGYLKASPLRGGARVRHALRERVFARPVPRLAEFKNLAWLREHGFHAPEPIVAGALRRRGTVRYQFLVTREVERARTLAAFLERADPAARRRAVGALARDVARLHDQGFVHRDLFPRNLLVRAAAPDEIWFIDAWRGGPDPQLRGPAYDHACLMLEGATLLTPAEQRLWFDAYLGAREGRPVDREAFVRRVARERDGLVRRAGRDRRKGRTAVDTAPWNAEALS